MSIFTDTMVEAIRKYRAMLRNRLPQPERVSHLHRLNLKNPQLYNSEVALYQLGYKIIDHLHQLDRTKNKNGYYSYSGIDRFALYLQKFLDKYRPDTDNDRVIHTSQLASRFMLKAMQLLAVVTNFSNDLDLQELDECHEMIARYGSKEQIELYKSSFQNIIRKHAANDRNGYLRSKLQHFMACLEEQRESAA